MLHVSFTGQASKLRLEKAESNSWILSLLTFNLRQWKQHGTFEQPDWFHDGRINFDGFRWKEIHDASYHPDIVFNGQFSNNVERIDFGRSDFGGSCWFREANDGSTSIIDDWNIKNWRNYSNGIVSFYALDVLKFLPIIGAGVSGCFVKH